MSHIDCPHCGARNLALFSSDLRRCRDCGRSLATDEFEQIAEMAAAAHRRLGRSTDWAPRSRFSRGD